MRCTRFLLGAGGVLLAGYGAWRIVTTARLTRPVELATWLAGALVLHDAVLAPAIAVVGIGVHRLFASRTARAGRFVAGFLVVAAMTSAVAIPLIHRRGHAPGGSTLEARNYGGGLAVVLGIVAGAALLGYVVRVVRDRR